MRKLSRRTIQTYRNGNLRMMKFLETEHGIVELEETHCQAIKEDFIKDMAEQYRGKLPDKVYRAMMERTIEATD